MRFLIYNLYCMNIENENENLKNILDRVNLFIGSIDRKSGLILSAVSFILAAVSFMSKLLDKWAFIAIISLLVSSVIFILCSILPIFWARNQKEDNPLYIPNIWKKKKGNLDFLSKEPNAEHYKSQIERVSSIYKKKIFLQIFSICLLAIALILLFADVIVVFVR